MSVNLKNNKYIENFKKGLQDISRVFQEGNYKLFAKQLIAVCLVLFLLKYANGQFREKMLKYEGAQEAVSTQKSNQEEYLRSKDTLFNLEPGYPDISEKNEGLKSKLIGIFKEANFPPEFVGNQTENAASPAYEVVSQQMQMNTQFFPFAEFIAKIESRDDFIKVTGFSIDKDSSFANLGNNKISLQLSTVFLKEKVAKSLFKDYDQIVAAKKAKREE